MFAIGIIIVFATYFISYHAVMRIKSLNFGASETKGRKLYCSLDFFYIVFTHGVFDVMNYFIFKVIMDVFACDYAVVPKTLY